MNFVKITTALVIAGSIYGGAQYFGGGTQVAKPVTPEVVGYQPKRVAGYATLISKGTLGEMQSAIKGKGMDCQRVLYGVSTGIHGDSEVVDVDCNTDYFQVLIPAGGEWTDWQVERRIEL